MTKDMKKIVISVFLTALAGLTSAFAFDEKTYVINVQDFNELQVIDNINVMHRCNPDSAGLAVFTCEPKVVSDIIFSNNKNRLKIELNIDVELAGDTLPWVTVYSNSINYAENCGEKVLIIDSPAPGAKFKGRVIGNGTLIANNIHATQTEGNLDTGKGYLELNGLTRAVNLKNIGTGKINAKNLVAETGSITMLGTGPIECQVNDELVVKGMGTGKVYVKGTPKIKKRALGSIEIINVE